MKKLMRAAIIPLIIFSFLHPSLEGIGEAETLTTSNRNTLEAKVDAVTLGSAYQQKKCMSHHKLCDFKRWLQKETKKAYTWEEIRQVYLYFQAINAKPKPIGCPSGYFCWQGGILTQMPCSIPDYICHREAGTRDGRIWLDVKNPGSSASGKYQFIDNTWQNVLKAIRPDLVDDYPHAGMAPEELQDQAAAYLYDDGNGAGHWSTS